MTFQWSNEEVFKLLDMFEKKEFLWNTSLEDYRDRIKKHEAWCEIANAFKVDRIIVEKKMKSLIGQFQRELKKDKSGSGCDEISNWFAFKRMMFLRNRSNRDTSTKEKSDNSENKKETPTVKHLALPKNYTNRKRPGAHEENMSEEALSILIQIHRSRQSRDEFDVFGEHVAIKLRQLNNPRAKNTAQYYINKILYRAAMGEYDWPTFNSPSHHATSRIVGYSQSATSEPYTISHGSPVSESSDTPGPSVLQSNADDDTQSFEDILNDIRKGG